MTQTQNTQQSQTKIHPIIQKILQVRGYNSETLKDFFSWNLTELPDLTDMLDLEKSTVRIIDAMNSNQKIGIYGDYDVDGTTSCALLYHFFQLLNVDVALFQPSRFVEGYGLHVSSIEQAREQDVSVLITVDCGITSCEAADYAKEVGLDLIITDHHKDAAPQMPNAYGVINPNRRDENKDEKVYLAGVGVAFALALSIKNILAKQGREIPSIYPLLQFVAIGTICDLAKLSPMNIKLTRHGLKQLPTTNYPGVKAFFTPEEREVQIMPSEKISFYVGPLINSKGRLDHPEMALKLLTASNREEALLNYSHLEICNKERKYIQNEVYKSAKDQVIQNMKSGECLSAIVYDPSWHEGVIGIVASKLVENFSVPSIVFTNSETDGIIKASARTAGELNLFDCLNSCSDLFEKFGGHKAAAGLSMRKENLPAFITRMNSILKEIPEPLRTKQDEFDLSISIEDIDLNLVKSLELLEPFGMGNAKPIFRMKDFKIESFSILKEAHVKWTFVSKNNPSKKVFGISFNFIGKWATLSPEELYDLAQNSSVTAQFTLGINKFRGNEYLQLMVDNIFTGERA